MKYYIGIDIGGTKMATLIADEHFNIKSKIKFETSETVTPEKTIIKFITDIRKQLLELNLDITEISGIGISCGGPLNSKQGVILSPPNLPGWDNVEIVNKLRKVFDVPVYLQNDANACALAEWKLGAGKGSENMIFLTFGTGMGAGLILNGRLYTGKQDMAGEVGHIRLAKNGPIGYNKNGSFEGFCSGGGIAQLAEKCIPPWEQRFFGEFTAKNVFEQAKFDNLRCAQIIGKSAEKLGQGLSILIDILNPEVIVIGSIFARQENWFKDTMNNVLKKEALEISYENCKIVPAILGDEIGDFASLIVATGDY